MLSLIGFAAVSVLASQEIPEMAGSRFKAALEIAAQRPAPISEITSLTFAAKGKTVSVMSFEQLDNGLELVFNRVLEPSTDLLSAGMISLHGLATVSLWKIEPEKPRIPYELEAQEIRVTAGQVYSGDSGYTLRYRVDGSEGVDITCQPVASTEARALHPSLTGHAFEFSCEAPFMAGKMRTWYLKNYGRYVTLYAEAEGEVLQDLVIHDVQFGKSPRPKQRTTAARTKAQ